MKKSTAFGPFSLCCTLDVPMTLSSPRRQEFGDGSGLADTGPLGKVHATLLQQPHGIAIPHALADGLWAEHARDFDDGFDKMPVDTIAAKVADEVLVDLEVVDRQALEIRQRVEPHTEVIERDSATQPLRGIDERAGAIDIRQRGLLSELQDQAPGIDSSVEQLALNRGDQIPVEQSHRGQVDRDLMCATAFA